MLAITIEHAVTNPIVRLSGTDLMATGCASVVIALKKVYFSLVRQNAEPSTLEIEQKCRERMNCPRISSVRCSVRFAKFSQVVRTVFKHQFASSMNAHSKVSVEIAIQLTVFLAIRPGALARVCEALANAESISMRWLRPILSITPLCV